MDAAPPATGWDCRYPKLWVLTGPRRPANRNFRHGAGCPDCRSPSLVAWGARQRSNPRPSDEVVGPEPKVRGIDRRPRGPVSEPVPIRSPEVHRRGPSPGTSALERPVAVVRPQPLFNHRPKDSPPTSAGDVPVRGGFARRARCGRGRDQWASDERPLRRPFSVARRSAEREPDAGDRPWSPCFSPVSDGAGCRRVRPVAQGGRGACLLQAVQRRAARSDGDESRDGDAVSF